MQYQVLAKGATLLTDVVESTTENTETAVETGQKLNDAAQKVIDWLNQPAVKVGGIILLALAIVTTVIIVKVRKNKKNYRRY